MVGEGDGNVVDQRRVHHVAEVDDADDFGGRRRVEQDVVRVEVVVDDLPPPERGDGGQRPLELFEHGLRLRAALRRDMVDDGGKVERVGDVPHQLFRRAGGRHSPQGRVRVRCQRTADIAALRFGGGVRYCSSPGRKVSRRMMRGPSAVESVWLGAPFCVRTSRGTGTVGVTAAARCRSAPSWNSSAAGSSAGLAILRTKSVPSVAGEQEGLVPLAGKPFDGSRKAVDLATAAFASSSDVALHLADMESGFLAAGDGSVMLAPLARFPASFA